MTQVRGGLSITQLATQTGFGPDTIRYYERTGLLPAPARTAGDHRRYDDRAVDRLRFIRGAKRLGLRLGDIGDLLTLRDSGTCPCGSASSLLGRRLAEVDAEISRLTELRGQLTSMLTAIPGPAGPDPGPACPDPVPGTWLPARPRGEVICDDQPVLR